MQGEAGADKQQAAMQVGCLSSLIVHVRDVAQSNTQHTASSQGSRRMTDRLNTLYVFGDICVSWLRSSFIVHLSFKCILKFITISLVCSRALFGFRVEFCFGVYVACLRSLTRSINQGEVKVSRIACLMNDLADLYAVLLTILLIIL